MIYKQLYCQNCNKNVRAEKQESISTGMGCFLTIITAGIFFLIWSIFIIVDGGKSYQCPHCGAKL